MFAFLPGRAMMRRAIASLATLGIRVFISSKSAPRSAPSALSVVISSTKTTAQCGPAERF
jgi:hypothetical protein